MSVSGGALVTGAGGGLGFEIARVLVRRGLMVHVTDVDASAAEAAAEKLGGGAFSSALDVRDASACSVAAQLTLERAGSLAVWVNNAGVLFPGPAWEQEEAKRRAMIEINALGTMNGTLAALELMRSGATGGVGPGGHVINIVSLAGIVAAPGETVYAASKHAVIAFSIGTMLDLRRTGIKNIHISCLCPDGIWTPMLHDKLGDPEAALSFLGTLLLPAQVAERAGKLLDKPRPVVTMPPYRGAIARAVDLFPGLGARVIRPMLAAAAVKQRRVKQKVEAGRWPPK